MLKLVVASVSCRPSVLQVHDVAERWSKGVGGAALEVGVCRVGAWCVPDDGPLGVAAPGTHAALGGDCLLHSLIGGTGGAFAVGWATISHESTPRLRDAVPIDGGDTGGMRLASRTTAVIAVLVIAAGGGLLAWSPWSSSGSSSPAALSDLMSKAGCTGSKVTQTELYARETGDCKVGGEFVSFSTFASTELRDQWVKAGAQFGGPPLVLGDTWLAYSESASARSSVASALGGKVS